MKQSALYAMANKPNGMLYIDALEKMDPGMEDSVDSRREPQCESL